MALLTSDGRFCSLGDLCIVNKRELVALYFPRFIREKASAILKFVFAMADIQDDIASVALYVDNFV